MLNAQLLENGQHLHQPAKVIEYTLTETALLLEISSKITNTYISSYCVTGMHYNIITVKLSFFKRGYLLESRKHSLWI